MSLTFAQRMGYQIDRIVGVFRPEAGLRRMGARATMSQVEALMGGQGGYDGGKSNRLTRGRGGNRVSENGVPREQIARVRYAARDLYRNNPHARKIVGSLQSKVIGRGPRPMPLARLADGSPHTEFRDLARALWQEVNCCFDYRGKPGFGGQSLIELHKLALSSCILEGDVLYRPRPVDRRKQMQLGLPIPLQLQLIHAERLVENDSLPNEAGSNRVYRGIELDADGVRQAYWLYDSHPGDPGADQKSRRVPANEIGHVYAATDIDQLRGVSWFAPALLQMRDTGDYQYNELKASALAACVALGIRRPQGSSAFGVSLPEDWSSTDGDGNTLTAMQPGMIIDLGTDGEMTGFNPNRPSGNAEAFIQHMQRAIAAAMPGVKSSTLTGDYRNSSFSSEKSADNDSWPEIEGLQDWFYFAFSQPIFEAVVTTGVMSGYFDGVITPEEFAARKHNYLRCAWQGPVARSINPTDDVKAAVLRIAAGISSPQIEAESIGHEFVEVLKQLQEAFEQGTAHQLPEAYCEQIIGLLAANKTAQAAEESADAAKANAGKGSANE